MSYPLYGHSETYKNISLHVPDICSGPGHRCVSPGPCWEPWSVPALPGTLHYGDLLLVPLLAATLRWCMPGSICNRICLHKAQFTYSQMLKIVKDCYGYTKTTTNDHDYNTEIYWQLPTVQTMLEWNHSASVAVYWYIYDLGSAFRYNFHYLSTRTGFVLRVNSLDFNITGQYLYMNEKHTADALNLNQMDCLWKQRTMQDEVTKSLL